MEANIATREPDKATAVVQMPAPMNVNNTLQTVAAQGTFPQFRFLPAEIRQSIWKLAAEDNFQVVELALHQSKEVATRKGQPLRISSISVVPAILHVSSEARFIGLKYFKALDVTTRRGAGMTYVNFTKDVILAHSHDILNAMLANEQIKRNATKIAMIPAMIGDHRLTPAMLKKFRALKRLFGATVMRGQGRFLITEMAGGPTREIAKCLLKEKALRVSQKLRTEVFAIKRDAKYLLKKDKKWV